MKRSSVVEKLAYYLPTESGLSNNEDASDILDFLEDIGLMPPNKNEYDMAIRNPKTGKWLITLEDKSISSTIPCYEWDQE